MARRTLDAMDVLTMWPWSLVVGALLGGLVASGLWTVMGHRRPLASDIHAQPDGVDTALDVIGAVGMVIDSHDRVIRASRSAVTLGLVDGRDITLEPVAKLVRRARRDGVRVQEEYELPRPNQQVQHVIVRAVPLGSEFVLVVADDRSDIYRIDAVRRDFLANISHELKTPIGAISLLAEALTVSADDPDQVRKFADSLEREAIRLGDLTSDIIELSRLQSVGRVTNPDLVSVDEVVHTAIEVNKVLAKSAGVELVVHAQSGAYVWGDQGSLTTAVHNLIRNAIQHSESPSRVGVGVVARGGIVDISVTDQGVGIAPAELERVFERFYRSDPARSRHTGGTGLGLSIVKHVVSNHDGQVRVWSQLGKGSTFTIKLREATADEAPPTGPIKTVVETASSKSLKARPAEYIATGAGLETSRPVETED